MRQEAIIQRLLSQKTSKFSSSLGIDLALPDPISVFKWFLASILFGARISEGIVVKTFKEFEKENLTSCHDILEAGWDKLVKVLDSGGYVRYDFKTADKLLEVMRNLKQIYQGDLNQLHLKAKDSKDLEERIKNLGKGIGEVTTNVFLRELRGAWEKATPLPSQLVTQAAKNLRLFSPKIKSKERILEDLKSVWQKNQVGGKDFIDFEAALVRLGKDYCRKRKCDLCVVRQFCESKNE